MNIKRGKKTLLERIARVTEVGPGPFGLEWHFVNFGGDGPAIPFITTGAKGAILDGYIGQTTPPTNVTVPDDLYNTMLQVVLETARSISTPQGAAAAEVQYNEASQFLSESYQDLLGVSYSGTLWDYLDVYTELDMDWVPHFLIWRESEAKKGTRSYKDWLKEQGLEPKKRRGLETTGESRTCPVPPVNCRTGGKQDPISCMEWEVQTPVRVDELIENGSFEDGIFVTVDALESYGHVCNSCSDTLPGWTVEGIVNRHNHIEWTANDGKYSIDLVNCECDFCNEGRGSLQQSFSTVVGDEYICSLAILAPGDPRDPAQSCNLDERTINVTIGGTTSSFTMSADVDEWENRAIPFTATSASTTIKIESGDPPPAGFWGVAVDSVSCKHTSDAEVTRYSFVTFLESCFVDGSASSLPSKSGLLPMGVDFLVNAAAVDDLVKGQDVRNSMYAIKILSCNGRVTAFAKKSFSDASCTSPYTSPDEALYGCTQTLNCGTAGHPIRAKNKKQPQGFHFKDAEGKCTYISWKDIMNGGEWCGGYD